MKKIIYTFLGLIILYNSSLFAQDDVSKFGIDSAAKLPVGLNIGDVAPIIYETAVNGEKINTVDLIGKEEVVVLFYRGQWCPVCNKYLSNLSDSLEMITSKAKVIVIGPETVENTVKESEMQENVFTIVADTSGMYMQLFDVVFTVTDKYTNKIKTFLKTDIAENNGHAEALLPVPATFVIGLDGKIKYRHFNYDYKVRASAKDILGALD